MDIWQLKFLINTKLVTLYKRLLLAYLDIDAHTYICINVDREDMDMWPHDASRMCAESENGENGKKDLAGLERN